MQDIQEELRQLTSEVRKLAAPIDLKLTALDERITQHSILFEGKVKEMETMIMNNSFKIVEILDRLKRIESTLKISPGPEITTRVPAHEDKEKPVILPPQKPNP